MKKKLIIFMPSVEGGGVEKNFFIISNYLATKLDKVYLITAENNLSKKIKNIKIVYPRSNFWRSKARFRKYIICVFLLIKILLKNRKILVFTFQANLYAILVCKLFRIKVISRSNSSPSGWSKNFIKNYIYKVGLNLADTIIVNSIEFKQEMKKKFSINATHIYNPLNKNEIMKLSKKKVKNLFPKKTLKIISVGRLVDQKNQLIILKAINIIKNLYPIRIVLIGRGIDLYKIKDYIKSKKLSRIVKIFYTSNPFPYIKQADLFILSSKYEGLPNVLLESIVLKKMIISSACPTGPKEILLDGKAGLLFKVGNYIELSQKIIFYIKNKTKCKKILDTSINNLNRFDYKINLKKYLSVIKKYLKKV
jgi:glycosyltransferase involved in cell wall biosynthesis